MVLTRRYGKLTIIGPSANQQKLFHIGINVSMAHGISCPGIVVIYGLLKRLFGPRL